jgi:CubicO group peptidase (beta-lactamase class C family)
MIPAQSPRSSSSRRLPTLKRLARSLLRMVATMGAMGTMGTMAAIGATSWSAGIVGVAPLVGIAGMAEIAVGEPVANAAQSQATPAQAPLVPPTPPATAATAHAYVNYTIPAQPGALDPLLPPIADAGAAGIDSTALAHLVLRARALHSDAVVILKDGRLLRDMRFGQAAEPLESGSIAKSVVAVAIGHLLYTGQIHSLDEPVATWYSEWSSGAKQAITLRQIINHTWGVAAAPPTAAIDASPDILQQALDAPLAHPPGSRFFYNNKAVNLLAGIVERTTRRKVDEYMRDEIFAPLGITRFAWRRDPAGNPQVFAGLALDARDLARLGQLMLAGGVYDGKRFLSADFVRESVAPAQPYSPTSGLLWWVIPEWTRMIVDQPLLDGWRKGGADTKLIEAVAPLAGREISRDEFFATLDRAFGHAEAIAAWVHNITERGLETPKVIHGPTVGFYANGSLGQYLVVIPASHLVAVRQIRRGSFKTGGDDFEDFPDMVRALAAAGQAAAAVQPPAAAAH